MYILTCTILCIKTNKIFIFLMNTLNSTAILCESFSCVIWAIKNAQIFRHFFRNIVSEMINMVLFLYLIIYLHIHTYLHVYYCCHVPCTWYYFILNIMFENSFEHTAYARLRHTALCVPIQLNIFLTFFSPSILRRWTACNSR